MELALTTSISQISGDDTAEQRKILKHETTDDEQDALRCSVCTQQHPVSLMLCRSRKELLIMGVHPAPFPEAFNSLNRK